MQQKISKPSDASDHADLVVRQKLMLSGLYLSKFDVLGRKKLGFENWLEAFNVIGLGLGAKPASVKGYRDEFDPLVSSRRKGWHKRPVRDHCRAIYEQYKGLDFETFTALVRSFSLPTISPPKA